MTHANKTAPHNSLRNRPIIIIIIIMALLTAVGFVISRQTSTIRKTMDDAAYQNMETMMRTIASTVNSTFLADQT